MATGEGPARSLWADLVIVCDLFAWRRGHTHPCEVCQVIAGGRYRRARGRIGQGRLLEGCPARRGGDPRLKHFGRHLPAELRTALDLGPVPAFTGAQCGDCGSRFGLEYDHVNPLANQGETYVQPPGALLGRPSGQDRTRPPSRAPRRPARGAQPAIGAFPAAGLPWTADCRSKCWPTESGASR